MVFFGKKRKSKGGNCNYDYIVTYVYDGFICVCSSMWNIGLCAPKAGRHCAEGALAAKIPTDCSCRYLVWNYFRGLYV